MNKKNLKETERLLKIFSQAYDIMFANEKNIPTVNSTSRIREPSIKRTSYEK